MRKVENYKIICDLDGKIISINEKFIKFFNLKKDSIIGIKRVFNFLHKDFIFPFIKSFEFFKKSNLYYFTFNSVLINNDNNLIFKIFLKKRKKSNIIFIKLHYIEFYKNKKNNFNFNIINTIIRTKFTLGSLMPFFFSLAFSFNNFDEISYKLLFFLLIGILFFHISANTFNDYFDWKSGRDQINTDYVLFSTGGSRSIDFGFISEKSLFYISIFSFIIVFLCGTYIAYFRGYSLFLYGLFGAFCVYFYSAPPIHLASRYGAGELMHIICLGPLISYCSVYVLTGHSDINTIILGLPFGLLITACLLLNEFPDSKSDKISGKNNLAVLLGITYIPYLFSFLIFSSYIVIFIGIFFLKISFFYLFLIFLLPYIINSVKIVFMMNNSDRNSISDSCFRSLNIYIYFSSMFIILTIISNIYDLYPW